MTSYKGLLNKIEAFCNAHLQIKKYGGEFKEQMPNFSTEDEKYPIVYVVPSGDLSDLNTNQFTLDVYCVDIIQKDRANINTIVSDCNLIVNDLYLYFLDGNDLSIDVIGASSGSPINNFDLDYSAGWVKSITFEVQAYSVCAIPMNPINPNPPQVCDPANYNLVDKLDNILASGSIDSGATENIVVGNSTVSNSDTSYSEVVTAEGNLDLPDVTIELVGTYGDTILTEVIPSAINKTITVNDSIVSNSDASYYAELLATSTLSLPDVTINAVNSDLTELASDIVASVTNATLNIPDITFTDSNGTVSSVPSGVDITATPAPTPSGSTAMVLKSGYTTTGVNYDDAYYQDGRSVNRATLSESIGTRIGSTNPLLISNTNRFTDLLFGQTYATKVALDWSTFDPSTETVVGYYTLLLDDNTSWATAQSLAHGKTFDSRSDWRVVNDQLLWNLRNAGSATSTLNFSPFNITSNLNVWTSTGAPRNSANAIYMSILTGDISNLAKTTNGPRYMIYRLYTLTELGL